ncbi:hypothetical protein Vretimale_2909 [Volvox reticuliferus]|uniref:DUF1995 domain-containing protein n=1 Tax=Volvox reticuliferus TaxID=1737510 RepID=A0A8J4DAJ1_9CHLO|nr:hypothetical protein Vretimale_2909 [Volvox reticuliferus]
MQASYKTNQIKASTNCSLTRGCSLVAHRRQRLQVGSVAARLATLELAPTSIVGPAPPPPRTVSEAIRQARMSLRLYREAAAAGSNPSNNSNLSGGDLPVAASTSSSSSNTSNITSTTAATEGQLSSSGPSSTSPERESSSISGSWSEFESRSIASAMGPRRLIVELPLPSQRVGFLGRGGPQSDLVMLLDEGDYPGGEQQRFRALRKLVDALLEGYDAEFLGCLEDGADGVGLWSCGSDMTLIANVTNATVPSLVKLFDGGYGSRVTYPGHTIVAVNPQWTDASSVGQPWQWRLRQRAAEVLDETRWGTLYSAKVLRGSRGANGFLHRAWPHRWALYPAAARKPSLGDRGPPSARWRTREGWLYAPPALCLASITLPAL